MTNNLNNKLGEGLHQKNTNANLEKLEEEVGENALINNQIRSYLKKREKALFLISPNGEQEYKNILKVYQKVIDEEMRKSNDFTLPDIISCSDCSDSSESGISKNSRAISSSSFFRNSQDYIRAIKFECRYFLPSALAMILFCTAHISLYEILTNILLQALKHRENNAHFINGLFIFVGFLISRMTGGAWYWINEARYSSAKSELRKKKYDSNSIEVKIQVWFKKHPLLRDCTDLFSVYIVFIGLLHFVSNMILPSIFDSREYFLENLPSVQESDIITSIHQYLASVLNSTTQENGVMVDQIAQDDYGYFYNHTSPYIFESFFGSCKAPLLTLEQNLAFYSISGMIAIMLLRWLDISLFEL